MSLAKRLFTRAEDSYRRKQFRNLQLAIMLGLACSAIFAVILYLLYARHQP